jgi:hypothetical protein
MASIKKRLAAAVAAAGLALGLGGCMGDYGYGGVGYASDYYGDYGYGNYGGYGYGPSLAYGGYGGWYNDFYYPGQGIYVFDRSGRRSRWNDGQRRYWEGRRGQWQGQRGESRRADWNGRRGYGRPDGQRPDGQSRYGQRGYAQRPDGQRGDQQRWQGRPGVSRPDGVPAAQGYTGRGQWRGNRQPGAGPDAAVGPSARPARATPANGAAAAEQAWARPPAGRASKAAASAAAAQGGWAVPRVVAAVTDRAERPQLVLEHEA